MNKSNEVQAQPTQEELAGILTAISIVAKRLARRLAELEVLERLGADSNAHQG
ncbi:MAG: hypothetical protein PHF89_08290 [Eubacteriales bacterium]|jgi:hypothetical protein|nr:hypothetical protein [Eubacteriales bacterium]